MSNSKAKGDIDAFLDGSPFAVVGASTDRDKYGNKVLRAYMQQQRQVYPVNRKAEAVEGLTAFQDIASLPVQPHAISVITPPNVTEQIVEQAIDAGIKHIWMQPGAESDNAVKRAREAGVNTIAGGPCILVQFGFRESH